jgi:hypothetical protein
VDIFFYRKIQRGTNNVVIEGIILPNLECRDIPYLSTSFDLRHAWNRPINDSGIPAASCTASHSAHSHISSFARLEINSYRQDLVKHLSTCSRCFAYVPFRMEAFVAGLQTLSIPKPPALSGGSPSLRQMSLWFFQFACWHSWLQYHASLQRPHFMRDRGLRS